MTPFRQHRVSRESPDEMDWSILDRYFSGDCSPHEIGEIRHWARRDPAHARLLVKVREIWAASQLAPGPRADVDRAWEEMTQAIALAGDGPPVRRSPLRSALPRPRLWTPLRALAAAALLMTAGATTWWTWGAPRPGPVVAAADEQMREYATARGQRAEVLLADGTRVSLSVDSRMRVPASYGIRSRTVYLEGEGYFVVTHDAQRPFLVHSGNAIAEDLGTEFLVRAYPGDSSVVVVVAEGEVALRDDRASTAPDVVLAAGDLGVLDRVRAVQVTHGVDVGRYLAWRDGTLAFRDMPLAQLARELERWYDVEISVADPVLGAVPVTATFRDQPIGPVLEIISGSLDATFTRDGSRVRFHSRVPAR